MSCFRRCSIINDINQDSFLVIPHIQDKSDSLPLHVYTSPWQPYFLGTYDVIYLPTNKVVKSSVFNIHATPIPLSQHYFDLTYSRITESFFVTNWFIL